MKNKYMIRSRISEAKFREIIRYFCLDLEAAKIAKIIRVSERTLCKIFKQIRILIAKECARISKLQGEIEINESYFNAKSVKRKKGRSEAVKTEKTHTFGIIKRNGCIYTQIVKNCSAKELLPILKDFSELEESIISSDSWKSYDGLVDYGTKSYFRVKHSQNESTNKNNISEVESFWGFVKHRLSKFKGIKKDKFYFHLKETEFRYNAKIKGWDLYQILLKLIRENPLKLS